MGSRFRFPSLVMCSIMLSKLLTVNRTSVLIALALSILVPLCIRASQVSSSKTKSTPADRLLRKHELKTFLETGSRSSNTIHLDSKEYKCHVLTALYRNARLHDRRFREREVVASRIARMLDSCRTVDFRMSEIFNQSFIFPGTKWCGAGNVAENYHDLGVFNETDACCREHDFCDDIIQPGKSKHNLINPYGTTRLHCKCDEAMRQCFRKVNSVISNTVGYIFFSLLQTQCYDFDYPTSGCLLWRRGAVRLYCVKYKFQEDEDKKWQWFDQEPYV